MNKRAFWSAAIVVSFLCLVVWPFSAPADSPVPKVPDSAAGQYQFNVLHAFGAPGDGAGAEGPLVFDQKGNLYGATRGGGANGLGTAFELTPGTDGQWTETILHNFPDAPGDGVFPSSVVMDGSGNLYGTTLDGGVNDDAGIVFELTPGGNGLWTETTIWNFCSLPNCADPGTTDPPTVNPAGGLYGGSTPYPGAIYQLMPDANGWSYATLYTFCSLPNCADGYAPIGSLTLDGKGNLYGETELGTDNGGTAFTLRPQADGSGRKQCCTRLRASRTERIPAGT
jgi:uncharacterized repeat protein (TIGR03803 family)